MPYSKKKPGSDSRRNRADHCSFGSVVMLAAERQVVILTSWWLPGWTARRLPSKQYHLVGYYSHIPQDHLLS